MENLETNQQSQVQNMQPNNIMPSRKSRFPVKFMTVALAIVLVLAVVGVAYLYITKTGPFAISPYTEKNLLTGISSAISKINSASYSVSASFTIDKRDKDAVPFTTKLSNADELAKRYKNDYDRANGVSFILGQLTRQKVGTYPLALDKLRTIYADPTAFKGWVSDPLTGKEYNYSVTGGGKNFVLTVNFETNDAISAIKKSYNFSASSTIINGKTVTFTKDSYAYFYLSSTPPKPFLVTMADSLSYFPPEAKINASVSAQSDFSSKDSANWKFNVDGSGDFGDLTYKVNIDALKKDAMYYFRINNLPSLFFSYIGFAKGQWIKIDPSKTASSSGFNPLSELPSAEKSYKENRQEISDFLKTMVGIASDENLIVLKSPPQSETIDGRNLFKYDLQIRKEAIVPFYQKLQNEVSKTKLAGNHPVVFDSGYLEYLQSPEFNEVFDYFQKNTALTLWVDSQGLPAIVSYSLRIVPQDSVAQLKDKQADLVFKLKLSDINKPADIKAPTDAKDMQEILKTNPYYRQGQDAVIKANLSTLLTDGAVFYDSNKSYNNWCSNEKYYFVIKKTIDDAYGTGSSVVCSCDTINCASAKKWCVSALENSGNYFCVDSSGNKVDSSKANVCLKGVCGK